MIWFKVIVVIIFSIVGLNVKGAFNNVKKPIQFVCVNDPSAEEFSEMYLEYDDQMATDNYTFPPEVIDDLVRLIGDHSKLILYILGYGSMVGNLSAGSFVAARDECEINNAAVCVVGYNYITLGNKYYLYWNTLNHRLPAINDILSHTSATIILNDRFKITMPTFYFTGYCLGAPIVGDLARRLTKMGLGIPPVIWALDPPSIGYSFDKVGVPPPNTRRRVQRGDAKVVIIFHLSFIGYYANMGNIEIIVNGGKLQPGCKFQLKYDVCNHFAARILRLHLVKRINVTSEMNGSSSGLPRLDGLPVAYPAKGNPHKPLKILFSEPPEGVDGIYHMQTGKIFGKRPKKPKAH